MEGSYNILVKNMEALDTPAPRASPWLIHCMTLLSVPEFMYVRMLSHSVVSYSLQPFGQQALRLLRSRDFSCKNTGMALASSMIVFSHPLNEANSSKYPARGVITSII